MIQFPWNPFPVLETPRLVLREMAPTDAPALLALRGDPDTMYHINRPPMVSLQEAETWIDAITQNFVRKEAINWAITLKGYPTLRGTVCLWKIAAENARAELGYLLHPDLRHQGLMREAVPPVLSFGFSKMKLHSIEAHVSPENEPSVRVLKWLGFVQEAHFRENVFMHGKFRDTFVFSFLAP